MVYERTMYYGSNPPPPMQPFPSSPGSYAPMYNYPPPQFEGGERPRANSHSHSHAHHSHSHHSHSHHSRAHSHSHSHGPPPPVVITVPPPPVKLQKIPTPTKHTFEKPLPQAPQTLNQVHQSHSLGAIPHFQYSKCTGRKKALCIGINYLKQPHELRGCINDARHVRDFLIKTWGYRAGDIVLLSDDSPNPRELPTRQNIIDAMRWLVRGAKTHDSLVFHYSGHGGQTKDLNGDEIDGYDEAVELQLHDFRVMAETLEVLGHTRAAIDIYTIMINRYELLDCFPAMTSRPLRIKRGACNVKLGRLAEAEEDLDYITRFPLISKEQKPVKKNRFRFQTLRNFLGMKRSHSAWN
ncbi:hypothetical protein H0H93_008875 [Arthromyces matolae]|nr:hypothetical protein H0H93_008875 [Arthromyces matolae]